MIDGLRPYPETKPSGLPWLGDLPAHWDVRRNGRLFGSRRETGFPDLPVLEVSLRSGVRVRDFDNGMRKQEMGDRSKYQRAGRGDIAYNMMRMWQGAVGIAPVDGLVSPAYVVARPFAETDAAYYAYAFRTAAYMREVDTFSRGIVPDRNRLYWESFKQMPSVYPPLDEQRLIVRFLDWHGVQTAKLVRAKTKIIALLNEQKQAIIHRAVTRGLDPNVRLKPSGIPWLGDVPEGWEVVPFKRRVGFQEGPGIMASDFRDEGIPLLRISGLHQDVATLEGCNFLDSEMVSKRWSHFKIRAGDYLLSSSASTGKVCRADALVEGAIPYTGIIRLWPLSADLSMPFLKHLIQAPVFQRQLNAMKSGVGIEHFGPTHLKQIVVCLPPAPEQRAIVHHIELATFHLATASAAIDREIALIQEFRTRLIADVVTGKLDVRAAAPSLPEDIEPEPIDDLAEDDLDEAVDDAENEEVAA
jgi:type I restriction enzyme S subunit